MRLGRWSGCRSLCWTLRSQSPLAGILGLAWRHQGEIILNRDRPFFPSLDDLPMPLHHLLPLDKQRMPMIKGPFTFIVSSRGCPAGCKYCIKHVSYQNSVRLRSPEKIFEELQLLSDLGIHNVHMYADLFTVNRDQVVDLCKLIVDSGLKVHWTCNSRVDYVDEEMLQLMGKAGCYYISWGIESANEQILKRAHKGYRKEQAYEFVDLGARGRHQQLGLFHHRPARRDRGDHPGDDRLQQIPAAGHRTLPHRRALSRHALLLRSRGEQLVPPRHQLGGGRHGQIHRARLRRPLGRAAGVLAEAGDARVVLPSRADAHLRQGPQHLGRLQERGQAWACRRSSLYGAKPRRARGHSGPSQPTPLTIRFPTLARRYPFAWPQTLFVLSAALGAWLAYDQAAGWGKFLMVLGGVALAYAVALVPERIHLKGGRTVLPLSLLLLLLPAAIAGIFLLTHDWMREPRVRHGWGR